ncbi:MAG TPA: dTDP-4-dehydrorhamnose reductase [Mycobacteriales bacterium]|nr:dTDP-4-dehydrorhamnose reductase [Mycobacteriales bacterium]
MTLLVVGSGGQLGRALQDLRPDARFVDVPDIDLTSRASVAELGWEGVSAVVNAAAWTAVDAAEDAEKLPVVWDVNATGVFHLAWHCRRLDLPLVHVSTDYVFRGDHTSPIPVDAPLDPQGAYGATKAAGEMAAHLAAKHYVVRTSWVFGDGPNFVRTMRRLGAEREELTVVGDQLGRPTYTVDLAVALLALLDRGAPFGTYHATGAGDVVSWADFAAEVLRGTSCRVTPVTTEQYQQKAPQAAPRPAYSALDLSSIEGVGVRMRDWREALAEYLQKEAAS